MAVENYEVWKEYVKLRKLGDYTPPWRKALRSRLLKRRAERIEEIEKEHPDYTKLYDSYILNSKGHNK